MTIEKIALLFILAFVGMMPAAHGQQVAVKTNAFYGAYTYTPNLGLEFGLARKWTLDVPVNYNPWKPDNGRRLRHWGIQPEVRYWYCG